MTLASTWESLKSGWRRLTPPKKLAAGGGAALLALLAVAAGSQGGRSAYRGGTGQYPGGQPAGMSPPGGYQGAYQGGLNPAGGVPVGGNPEAGYQAGAYQGGPAAYAPQPGPAAANGGDAADSTGYWARQRSQDQQAQAFGGYINDTTTVRDSDGQVHADVPNAEADPAIANGSATAVPTAELPTSTPEPAPEPAPTGDQ